MTLLTFLKCEASFSKHPYSYVALFEIVQISHIPSCIDLYDPYDTPSYFSTNVILVGKLLDLVLVNYYQCILNKSWNDTISLLLFDINVVNMQWYCLFISLGYDRDMTYFLEYVERHVYQHIHFPTQCMIFHCDKFQTDDIKGKCLILVFCLAAKMMTTYPYYL